jgi:hypothetical protein
VQVQNLPVEPWSDTLAANVLTFPDHILHRLAAAGIGRVDAELPVGGDHVLWEYVPRLRGARRELARQPIREFRPVLARFATVTGISPYGGYAAFAVEPFPEWPADGTHRFSLYLCNEPAMGLWARLYLYCIDGVWPMPRAAGRSADT